jgi:argininosuccinate lyase
VVGKAVAHGVTSGEDLAAMSLQTLQGFCADIGPDVYQVLTLEGSVAARNHLGGTAPVQVTAAAERALARVLERPRPA